MSISTYLDELLGDWRELLRGWRISSGAIAEEGQDFVLVEQEATLPTEWPLGACAT